MYEYTSKFGKQTVGTLFRKGSIYFIQCVIISHFSFKNAIDILAAKRALYAV